MPQNCTIAGSRLFLRCMNIFPPTSFDDLRLERYPSRPTVAETKTHYFFAFETSSVPAIAPSTPIQLSSTQGPSGRHLNLAAMTRSRSMDKLSTTIAPSISARQPAMDDLGLERNHLDLANTRRKHTIASSTSSGGTISPSTPTPHQAIDYRT